MRCQIQTVNIHEMQQLALAVIASFRYVQKSKQRYPVEVNCESVGGSLTD